MKIKIVAEDKKKGKVEIPLSIKQIRDIYDMGYWIDTDDLKFHKADKNFYNFHHKLTFLVHDVIDDGGIGRFVDGKYKRLKEKHYHVKKPKWKK